MIDPITFEVLRHRLSTIVDEGAAVMRKVSGSPSVAQSNDCNVALLTTVGEGVIIGRTIASHAMSCIQTSKYVLKEYQDNPGIGPGDMFFTNHPYIGTPHQTCGVLVAPIFVGNRIIAWSGAGIHFGDVGGSVPGQVSIGARSIWDEAIPLPPIKIVQSGVLRKDLEDDFLIRSRTRVQNAVDLKAMVGANNAIARRIQALAQRYGTETLIEALDQIIATSELKLRGILREAPDGAWSCENFIDYYDQDHLKIYACRLTLTKQGDRLVFDFTKSSKQAPAVVNATFAATEGYLLRAMLGIFGFAVANCPAAIQRVVRIEATEGTIVHCAWPAGVSKGTTSVTQSVWQVATHCLSQMLLGSDKHRDRAVAVSRGNLMILDLMGTDQYGGPFAAVLQECCLAAGSAAGAVSDGIDTGGVTEPEVSIPNVESNEFRYPVLYLYRRQRADSGGPGTFRGGVGLSMAFMPHNVDEIPNVMVHTHGVGSPSALGLAGGYPAVTNFLSITRNSNIATMFGRGIVPTEVAKLEGERVERPPPFTYTRLKAGDVFECGGGGGGGYGDPIDRAPELVLHDVQNGIVSREQAKARYGIVIGADKTAVDATATAAERAAIRKARQASSNGKQASSTAKLDKAKAAAASGGRTAVRCRCGHYLHAGSGEGKASLPARATRYAADAYTLAEVVHKSPYVINEIFCPACWSVVETQVSVPQVET
jgi:N-methylhydantoinase B